MDTQIKEYLISGEKARDYNTEICKKISLKQLPTEVIIGGIEGCLVDMKYYFHIGGASVKIEPKQDKLRIMIVGQDSAQQTAKSKLEEIFGGKIE